MAQITAALIKELQQRTGAGIRDCEQALAQTEGDLIGAAAIMRERAAKPAKSAEAATFYTNQFLVAMPGLADENFSHTVTLLCEHNDKGALGLVINRPTDLSLREMLDHMELGHAALIGNPIVHWGGPVQPESGFV